MGRLSNYKSKAPEFQKLGEGTFNVRLVTVKETDSAHNYDGTVKEKLPEYVDVTEQLAITVVSTEGKGGMTHRLNGEGYLRFSELTDEEVKSKKFVNINEYACAKNAQGKLERIPDEKKTAACDNIIDQFMAAIQMPEGSGLDDITDEAIAKRTEFQIVVVNDEWDGKDQFRIKAFKKVAVEADATADLER
jgi:hypothetical protein